MSAVVRTVARGPGETWSAAERFLGVLSRSVTLRGWPRASKGTSYLHVFGARSSKPQENRVFRAYLAAHPEEARRYEVAKRAAAQAHPDSRGRYAGAKEAVMFELLEQSRVWGARR